MFYRKSISLGGEANNMKKQEISEEISLSRIADEIQKKDSQEEKRSRPVNT